MPKSDYLPTRDNDFLVWHDQFSSGVTAQAATFGLAPADTAQISGDNADLHTKIAAMNSAVAAASQATANKTASRASAEGDVRALVRRIKAHPAYTPAIGSLLGIEGPQSNTDLSGAKPTLTATDQTGGVVQLQFSKSASDGVNIYSKRDNDADYVFLSRDTSSPYVDNRPLLAAGKPEMRHYKAIYIQNDVEVGNFSDEVIVACQP